MSYTQSETSVKRERYRPPTTIVMMTSGERVCWPARDVADSLDGVFAYVADMVALGWSAMREGDSIILHPVEPGEPIKHRRH